MDMPSLQDLARRRSSSQFIEVAVANTLTQLASSSEKRVAIFFGVNGGAGNFWRVGPHPVATNRGTGLNDTSTWVRFTIEQDGSVVQGPWEGTSSGAGIAVNVIETFQD